MNRLKRMNKNENIQNFYKNIEQENSNVLAQNINMMKKRFDFNIFKSPSRLKIKNLKSLSNEKKIKNKKTKKSLSTINLIHNENDKKKNKNSIIIKQNDELWKVGNELKIRKRIIHNTKTEIKDNEELEEIKIENKMLKFK